jgi:hypothetical protein
LFTAQPSRDLACARFPLLLAKVQLLPPLLAIVSIWHVSLKKKKPRTRRGWKLILNR